MSEDKEVNWKALRADFKEEDIGWKAIPTKAHREQLRNKQVQAVWCDKAKTYRHPKCVPLAYVGHAAVTKRLLDFDPNWSWDFLATDESGMPLLDQNGGLWITLTIKGVTRKGYGDAQSNGSSKSQGDLMKEAIGDAIRNAAMRFGVALELWHKGEFAKDDEDEVVEKQEVNQDKPIYPTERFNENLPQWEHLINKEGKDADSIIKNIMIKFRLTPEQLQIIHNMESKEC